MLRKCRQRLSSDEVFELYKTSTGAERQENENHLIRLLERHGNGITFMRLREVRPDIVNQAITKALFNCSQFEGRNGARFSTWFQQIVENLIRNELRKRLNRREVSFEDLSREEIEAAFTVDYDPDQKILVQQVLKQLSPAQTRLVRLRLDGFTLNEIATAENQPLKTMETRWNRLSKTLRKKCH